MKKHLTRAAVLCLSAALALGLTSCALGDVMNMGGVSAKDVTAHVQGMMDAAYLGQANEDYIKVTEGVTEQTCKEDFQANLDAEFEQNFAYWFEIDLDYTTKEVQDQIKDMIAEVYSHAKYEVKEATKNSEGNFMVEVIVEPVDTFAQVWEYYVEDFSASWNDACDAAIAALDLENMTDGELDAFQAEWENKWSQGILDLCNRVLPDTGHLPAQSIVLQVKYNEDSELYELVGTDWQNLDSIILAYYFDK